ncbi:uncharacterized protein LOC112202396 isoform X2 [Rosa chinensis]|nr:uncharacterized protein LOC112202396 isoform X2 [Rosa chinensis]XP_040362286.1 uncharacterized protein LOC112202396 isoform X2 [Rosa chinensis]
MGKNPNEFYFGVSFRSGHEHVPSFEDASPTPVIDGGGGVRVIRPQSKVLNKISATSPNLPAVSSLLLLRLLWSVNFSWCFDWYSFFTKFAYSVCENGFISNWVFVACTFAVIFILSMGITEALRLQVELQKRLHEQLERDRFFLDRLECKVKQNSYFIS